MSVRERPPLRLDNGRVLTWCEAGPADAPRTALYLHGTGGSRLEAGVLAEAAERYGLRIVSWNRPRHGHSTAVEGRRIEDVVADARAVIEAAGLVGELKPAAIGVSGGGSHVVALAALAPDLIRLAVPVNAGVPAEDVILEAMPADTAKSIRMATRNPLLFGLIGRLQSSGNKLLRWATIRSLSAEDRAVIDDPTHGPLFERSGAEGRTQKGAWLEEARMFWAQPWGSPGTASTYRWRSSRARRTRSAPSLRLCATQVRGSTRSRAVTSPRSGAQRSTRSYGWRLGLLAPLDARPFHPRNCLIEVRIRVDVHNS